MVCANIALALEQFTCAHCFVLGGHGRVGAVDPKCMATWNAGYLLRLLSFIRQRCARFFRLSIGWHAARGRFHRAFLCSARVSPRHRSSIASISRQFVLVAMGVVSHLLRIRGREDGRWGSRMAQFYGDG